MTPLPSFYAPPTSTYYGSNGPDNMWVYEPFNYAEAYMRGGNDVLQGYVSGGFFASLGDGDDVSRVDSFNWQVVTGGNGNDFIVGGHSNDSLYGDNGDDFLVGGAGDDVLVGGPGNDVLIGGRGKDLLIDVGGFFDQTYIGAGVGDTAIVSLSSFVTVGVDTSDGTMGIVNYAAVDYYGGYGYYGGQPVLNLTNLPGIGHEDIHHTHLGVAAVDTDSGVAMLWAGLHTYNIVTNGDMLGFG